jgi:hypothetical protein
MMSVMMRIAVTGGAVIVVATGVLALRHWVSPQLTRIDMNLHIM